MTTATQAQAVNAQVFLFVLVAIGLVLAYVAIRAARQAFIDWWDDRDERRERRRQENLERDVRIIETSELDEWEAEILADPLPEAVADWPTPLHPRMTDFLPAVAAPQPLPVRWDPAVRADDTYLGYAGQFAADMRDRRPVYDEQAYAESVFASLRQPTPYVDAPVSPMPWDYPEHRPRHALGSAPGTETQRALWEHDTGAWPVVRELTGVAR